MSCLKALCKTPQYERSDHRTPLKGLKTRQLRIRSQSLRNKIQVNMPNTYTQIYIHVVFCVQNRRSLIQITWETELYKYITGIAQSNGHKMLAINGMPDHMHMLIGLRPYQSLSKLLQEIKCCSARWINENKLVKGKFHWQKGFGAFSYKKADVPMIINYIRNQKEHHYRKTFRKEYIEFLKEFNIDYDERFIFKEIE